MIVERGVNEYADRAADALDTGRPLDAVEVIALAQEIVRLTHALKGTTPADYFTTTR